jgi:hypothetical protein
MTVKEHFGHGTSVMVCRSDPSAYARNQVAETLRIVRQADDTKRKPAPMPKPAASIRKCARCGAALPSGAWGSRKYCADCERKAHREQNAEHNREKYRRDK